MPATKAPSAIPPNALPIWTDGKDIFTELPGPNGPVVIRYHRDANGLSAMLGLIHKHAYDGAFNAPPVTLPEPKNQPGAPARQLAALDILKRMGIIP